MSATREPSRSRLATVVAAALLLLVLLFACARALGPVTGAWGALASVGLGLAAGLVTGSLGEWLVHRHVMHRPLGPGLLRLPYELHHRAHHWVQFPPDEYVQRDRVQRVPTSRRRLDRVCTSALGRAGVVLSHLAFYSVFALLLAVLPALAWAGNGVFTAALSAEIALFLFLFVHVHDAVHHPGLSPLERLGWFRFLDRHHYVHHVDTAANTNFLLPLADLALGTLRRDLSAGELERWPSYDEARRHVVQPEFGRDGRRVRPARARG